MFSGTKPPDSPYKNTWGAYQTDLYSGSFNYNFKIVVPPGTNGLAPRLSLSYNNQNAKGKAGWVGAGWEIPLTYIQRNIQHNRKNNSKLTAHTFELYFESAKHNLVTSDTISFHTQVETYYRVIYTPKDAQNKPGDYWTVTTKDGTQYRFGYNSDSKTTVNASDPKVPQYTWRWSLDQIKDTNGNCINFSYFQDQGAVYLDKITYNNDGKRVIKFIREPKPDAYLIIDQGSEVYDAYRLQEIDVLANDSLVRKYVLAYTLNQAQNKSLLASITEYGSDETTSLPPVKFLYATPQNGFNQGVSWSAPSSLATDNYGDTIPNYLRTVKLRRGDNEVIQDVFDVNGDGLPDLVVAHNPRTNAHDNWHIWLNTGNGFVATMMEWGIPTGWAIRNNNRSSTEPATKTAPMDFDEDGYVDFIHADGSNTLQYVANKGSGFQSFTNPSQVTLPINAYIRDELTPSGRDPRVQQTFVDMNGDGIPDLVQRVDDNTWHVWINDGKGNFVNDLTWTVNNHGAWIEQYTSGDDSNMLIGLYDVNGDGLPDLVDAHDSAWHIYLNTGSNFIDGGTWDTHDPSHNNINNTRSDGSVTRDFIDINGDGLPDIVDAGFTSHLQVWFNTGKGFLADPTTGNPFVWSLPNAAWSGHLRDMKTINSGDYQVCTHDLFDIDGDGLVDIVWRSDDGTWKVYSNLSGPTDLLSNLTDRLGSTINVNYSSSSKAANYQNTRLPFNFWVVSSVTASNGMSGPQAISATTAYSYAKGFFDFPTKEFRGFGQVTETKPDETKVMHYFRQDLSNDTYQGLKGKEYETDVQSSSGAPFASTQNNWSSSSSNGVVAPQLNEKDEFTYDGSADNPKKVKTQYQNYDPYGSVGLEIDYGNISTDVPDTFSYSDFTYNTDLWIVDRVAHKKVTATASGPSLRESWYYYDGAPSDSAPPTAGNLTKEEHYLDTGENAVSSYEYDSYGNRIKTTDPNGHSTTILYDSLNTFPWKTTNDLGQTTTQVFDSGTGNLFQVTDPNEFITQYGYDVFGRKTSEIKPYDSAEFPTTSISYSLNGTAPSSVMLSRRETPRQAGTFDTLQFVDGFGQLIQTTTESWSNDSTTITTDVFYDTLGRLQKQTNPFFSSSGFAGYLKPTGNELGSSYLYDTLGRPIRTTNPDGSTVSRVFDHWNVTETDENGHVKSYLFDAYQRLIQVTENNAGQSYVTNYSRDPLGQLTQITDNLGKITKFQYDSMGRKTSMLDPDRGAWSYAYDPAGNLVSQTDSKGITTQIVYDQLNRKQSVQTPHNSVAYTYDQPTIGTLSSVQNSDSGEDDSREIVQTSWTYDSRLRKTSENLQVDGNSWSTLWSYDSMDRVVTQTYPNGERVTFNYDTQGKLDNIPGIVMSFQYDAAGHTTVKSYANGTTTNYGYDGATLRLTNLVTSGIQDLSYTHDYVGNIKTITDGLSSLTESFTYDDLDRLTQAGDSTYQRAYQYDSVGDMISSQKDGKPITYSYDSSSEHAVSGMTVPFPVVGSFVINSGDQYAQSTQVTLSNVSFGNPTSYMASENPGFSGASWQTYSSSPSFTLSPGAGKKTVYFKVQNSDGVSDVKSDDINLVLPPAIDSPSFASVATSSAILGAVVENDGGQAVTSEGVAYGLSSNPDIAGTTVTSSSLSPSFSVNVTGLSSNTVYHFRGYATNPVGTGYTADTTFTTLPGAPTANSAALVSNSGFTANWNAPTGNAAITVYELDVATDSAFTSILPAYNDISVSETSLAVTGLSAGTTYYYRVRAVNSSGTSANSNSISVSVYGPPIIDMPVSPSMSITTTGATLGATIESSNGSTVTATGVAYGRSVNPDTTGTKVSSSTTIGAFSVSVTGLYSNSIYHYRGYATNSFGTNYTTDTTFTTLPEAPTAISATDTSNSGFTAKWTAPAGTATITYKLDVATDKGFTSFVPGYGSLSVVGTSSTVTGLDAGTTYYYRVKALNSGGESLYSDTISVTTGGFSISSPRVTSITSSSASLGATLASKKGSRATAAGVVYGLNSNPDVSGTKKTTSIRNGAFSVKVTRLSSDTLYHFRGYVSTAQGTVYTDDTTFTTLSSPPKATAATPLSPSGFIANWVAPSGSESIEEYALDVATDSTFKSKLSGYSNLSVSGTSQAVTGLQAGGSYYYRVRAINAGGASAYSNTIKVTTSIKASAGPDQRVSESTSVTLNGSNSVCPRKPGSSIRWTQLDGPRVRITRPTSVETGFLAPQVGSQGDSLRFLLKVTGKSGVKSEDQCLINIVKDTAPPTACAGPNQTVGISQIVQLDASQSSSDTGIVSYSWRQISGSQVSLSDSLSANPTFLTPNVGNSGESLVFELTVANQAGLRSRDTCIVNVISENLPPHAQVGENQRVAAGDNFILDASGSTSDDSQIVSYIWRQIAGPPVTLSDPTAVQPSFTAPLIDTASEDIVFELTVTDDEGLQDKAKVVITVMADQ